MVVILELVRFALIEKEHQKKRSEILEKDQLHFEQPPFLLLNLMVVILGVIELMEFLLIEEKYQKRRGAAAEKDQLLFEQPPFLLLNLMVVILLKVLRLQ